jgi:hypothetical protein
MAGWWRGATSTTLEAWLTEKEEEGRSRQPEQEEGEESHSARPFL